MGKRYYCDYCDRSFKDDFDARKKHVTGTMHIRNRKEHYNSFRDPETILAEESAKITCKRFSHSGECPFGSNCRFTHYLPRQLSHLRLQIEEEKTQKLFCLESTISDLPSKLPLGEGMDQNTQYLSVGLINDATTGKRSFIPNWKLPVGLQSSNLPISLQPFNLLSFGPFHCEEWG